MKISKKRPVEKLVGANLGWVRQRLGRIHVGTPMRETLRVCRPNRRAMKGASPALRRGLILAVLTEHNANRAEYALVMGGGLGRKQKRASR